MACPKLVYETRMPRVEIEIVEAGRHSARWDLVRSYLFYSQEGCVKRLNMDLNLRVGLEFDQYDTLPIASYLIAHEDGVVSGGARLVRCNTRIGLGPVVYSYMIRDAWQGIIHMPHTVCWKPPTISCDAWELSRFGMFNSSINKMTKLLLFINSFLRDKGAKECLFLGTPSFTLLAQACGLRHEVIGEIFKYEGQNIGAISWKVPQ